MAVTQRTTNQPANANTAAPADSQQVPDKVIEYIKRYLIFYNVSSTVGWGFYVLFQLLKHLVVTGGDYTSSYEAIGYNLVLVQCFAALEIVHAFIGIVKADIKTTIMQIASRLFLCWIVSSYDIEQVQDNWAFTTMVLAWSITELVRYWFYAMHMMHGPNTPYILGYLRYTLFYVLYPVGAGSEFLLIIAAAFSDGTSTLMFGFLMIIAAIYGPGFYHMYTHMIRQRKKYLV